jgi:pimeloyl-ACP methyl ester carboxylesterase
MSTAYPSGGGFDERPALLCLHHAGGSGRLFTPILSDLGNDRSVYAPDLPGHGSSDAGGKYSVAELAGALGEFLDALRLRTVDVFGYELGAQIAAELAIARPQQIRRVLLWGIPPHAPQDRAGLSSHSIPLGSREDGGDVAAEWQRLMERRGPGVPVSALAEELADRLRASKSVAKARAATLEYAASERLPLVKQPTLVLRLRDEYWDQAPRTRASLPNAGLLDLSEHGAGFISAAPQKFASVAREFLDR